VATATYTAPAISCQHCQHTIESVIGALTGVEAMHVYVRTERVEVRFDPTKVNEATLVATENEEGFPVAG